jgi:hypothetical protein
MSPENKKIFRTAFFLLGALFLFTTAISIKNYQRGTLNLELYQLDLNGLTAKLNNKSFKVNSLSKKYQLSPGAYAISITQPGYKLYKANFVITARQVKSLNIVPAPAQTPPILSLTNTVNSLPSSANPNPKPILGSFPSGSVLDSIFPFYGNTWAAYKIDIYNSSYPNPFMVSQYDFGVATYNISQKKWINVIPPIADSRFTLKNVSKLPAQVYVFVHSSFPNSGRIKGQIYPGNWVDPT